MSEEAVVSDEGKAIPRVATAALRSMEKPVSDIDLINVLIKKAELFQTNHRELGMANQELIKSLKTVETWLKTVEDIEADIKKKAKK